MHRNKRTTITTCPLLLCVPKSEGKRRRRQRVRTRKDFPTRYAPTLATSRPFFIIFRVPSPPATAPSPSCLPPPSLQVHGLKQEQDLRCTPAQVRELDKQSRLVFSVCGIVACREDRVHKAKPAGNSFSVFEDGKQFFLFLRVHGGNRAHSATPQGASSTKDSSKR